MFITAGNSQAPITKRVYAPQEEPPNFRGLLFKQEISGEVEILKYSGETDPDSSPDIPPDAVTSRGVYISVDGIGQDWNTHRQQIADWFHGGADYGVKIAGPVIGIHEGEGKNSLSDGLRILKNTVYTKALQSKLRSPDSLRASVYADDPSVKAIYDQLSQSLRVGREVTLMAHSGGASQVALALTLLAQDSRTDWKPLIAEKVRVLGTAPAAHRQDLEAAGVESDKIMITGSVKDPVYRFYRNFLNPKKPLTLLSFLADGLSASLQFALNRGPFHQGEYIFSQNIDEGNHRIGQFLEGGKGSDSPLP